MNDRLPTERLRGAVGEVRISYYSSLCTASSGQHCGVAKPAVTGPDRSLSKVSSLPPTVDFGAEREPWHREAVGGLWDVIGPLQLSFLRDQGLQPGDQLLDIGCGSLRGGIQFVGYLDADRYCGIDADAALLEAGREELASANLDDRGAVLLHDGDFRLDAFGRSFDFAIAQSLFTHLPLNRILRCLLRVQEVLRPGGTCYATFFENRRGTKRLGVVEHPATHGGPISTYPDADPYHYGFDAFEWLCADTALEPRLIGDWGHPRGQRMLAFQRRR